MGSHNKHLHWPACTVNIVCVHTVHITASTAWGVNAHMHLSFNLRMYTQGCLFVVRTVKVFVLRELALH